MIELNPILIAKRGLLLEMVRRLGPCAVAFSGGVDSAVVAQAARLALGDAAVAVTGVSASLAEGELDAATHLAQQIGIRHVLLHTGELGNPAYVRNGPDRCYHCKTELYTLMERHLEEWGVGVLLNGANADDVGDYRPGMRAAGEHRVRSPLLECGIRKAEVRQLAAHWKLPVWEKPAAPCLSSRIAYGEEVTPHKLAMIDRAEQFLRQQGLRELRVRLHRGELARIEVPPEELPKLAAAGLARQIVAQFKALGFTYVTLDLEGFRSGSLNALVPIETLSALPAAHSSARLGS
jgi:uncharacterized protein